MLTDDVCTGPINLGNNSEFTILELAEKVISFTNSRSKLVFKPLPSDDPRQRKPDLSKAKALLDWEPKIALADGLKETVAYFKRSLETVLMRRQDVRCHPPRLAHEPWRCRCKVSSDGFARQFVRTQPS